MQVRSAILAGTVLLSACAAPQQDHPTVSAKAEVASRPPQTLVTTSAPAAEPKRTALPPEELYELLSSSVWLVVSAPMQKGEPQFNESAIGSAVAVGPNRLLTNCHVVSDGGVVAILREGDTRIVDVSSAHFAADICILQTDRVLQDYVQHFRTLDDVRTGERAYTLGNPRGMELTLAEGLVSAKRNLRGYDWIQTTAPISPGSSGGGLFDAAGNLIGITTFLRKDSQQLNFASPIKLDFVPELLAQGGQRRTRQGTVAGNPRQPTPGVISAAPKVGPPPVTVSGARAREDRSGELSASSRPGDASEFEVHTFED